MKRAVVLAALSACIPDLGARDSLVTRTQVLAIVATPPEAAPGSNVHYDLLVGSPEGVVTEPASWGYCTAAKLLEENGAVSASCLTTSITTVANGPSADAPVPGDACQIFGPDVTAADLRPRDPDITGGYYQPLRVRVSGEVAYGLERVTCQLHGASSDIAADFVARTRANTNPVLRPVAPLAPVTRGAHIRLRADWPAESAEPYVVFDLATNQTANHRESLRVSWFATAGTFDADRTGRTDTELETFTENGWTAPAEAGSVHFFVVLRDDRGGATFTSFDAVISAARD